jgi:prepilin-type N-terminal cleavage/methylation domain-containing protein
MSEYEPLSMTQIPAGRVRSRIADVRGQAAFTLVEVMVSLIILAMVIAGVCYGYSEMNRITVWDSMSQAAQAMAVQGMESARAAKWNPWVASTNTGPAPGSSQDELPATNGMPALMQTNVLSIPLNGTNTSLAATNYIYVTQYAGEPPIRQIWSQCVWTFPFTGQVFTNNIITLRGPDQ